MDGAQSHSRYLGLTGSDIALPWCVGRVGDLLMDDISPLMSVGNGAGEGHAFFPLEDRHPFPACQTASPNLFGPRRAQINRMSEPLV